MQDLLYARHYEGGHCEFKRRRKVQDVYHPPPHTSNSVTEHLKSVLVVEGTIWQQ